ncbi:MAG: PQQ-binding-like beta-propeller repeat protein [Myxococcota bacterium]
MDAFHELETKAATQGLRSLLLGPNHRHLDLPLVSELTAAATSLARGVKRKALLPLELTPTEFALVRRGSEVLVTAYETGSAPEVHQRDRRIPLDVLLRACANATLEDARHATEPTARQIAVRLAERALRTEIAPDPGGASSPEVRRGGALEADDSPISFGFEIAVYPNPGTASRTARADVHAMLFEGRLWAFLRGRRIQLGAGPVMLSVQRMVALVRALATAWECGRTANVRLRAGSLAMGVRLDANDEVALSFATEQEQLGAAALDVPSAALPILRLASEMLRTLVAIDRTQLRNLRVSSLRDEVRDLRGAIRRQSREDGFVNRDPDRMHLPPPDEPARSVTLPPVRTQLRFDERWRIALDDLDASSVFFCGDRLVLSSATHTVAVDRDHGEVLWAREGSQATMMAGRALLRLSSDGDIEICDVSDGEPRAYARIAPRIGGPTAALVSSGEGAPPTAIFAEGDARLVAIDLRTGEPRWRFRIGRGNRAAMSRVGRIVIIAHEGAVHAVDLVSGDDLWRYTARCRFEHRPAIVGDVAIVAARRDVIAIDLVTGEERWRQRLPHPAAGEIVPSYGAAVVPLQRDRAIALDAANGSIRWTARDPGLGCGGSPLTIDNTLIVNAPGGQLSCVDLHTGEPVWTQVLGDPLGDEVPRQLEPVLRGGALFVPAGKVHIVGPRDGTTRGEVPCDLVPDRVRVDERGWVYVAEESGYVAAYAPAPTLRLIRGGK